ncbi:MAG: cohesin domain-containing protein [Candidatus Bathyarchaeota archaeon]|nr:cohesin domain-containing protein [Candidatus Bathyarchaeota archaeon]MDW8022591.1 cohesin domain-containing protein [Nitrososphaerota archaeon]
MTEAQTAVVSIKPTYLEVPQVGESFDVDINITNVNNLFAYELQVFYMRNVVNCIRASRPPGHFLEPKLSPDNYLIFKWEIENEFNATHGRIWLAYTLKIGETGRSGSGILVRLTFISVSLGTTPLILADDSGRGGHVLLARYPDSASIPNVTEDGMVKVIPEFSIEVILLAFLITSSFAIALTMKSKSNQTKA